MIAANVHSSQLENVEASTVVNVKGRKVRGFSWCGWNICFFFNFKALVKIQGWDNRICDRANPSKVSARARDNIPSNNSVNKVKYKSKPGSCSANTLIWLVYRKEARRLKREGVEILVALGHAGHGLGHGHWHGHGYGHFHGYSHSQG